jgi:small subunit ribosomal protein S3Ae
MGRYVSVKRRRRKRYFTIVAPSYFGERELNEVVATSPDTLLGRTYTVLLSDLINDPDRWYVKVKLKIIKVDPESDRAYTIYAGQEYLREYFRSLVMRGTSYIDCIKEVRTADNINYRITVAVFTTRRINTSKKRAIRKVVFDLLNNWSSRSNNEKFINDVVTGAIDVKLEEVSKKIYPIRHAGVAKVKLLGAAL